MGFKTLGECHAFQLAREFKGKAYTILEESPRAMADARYRTHLQDALSSGVVNIGEGFYRLSAGEICHFLRIALGSLEEGILRVEDGIDRGYFSQPRCEEALRLGHRAIGATRRWWESLEPFVQKRRGSQEQPRGRDVNRRPSNRSRTTSGADDDVDSERSREPRTEP